MPSNQFDASKYPLHFGDDSGALMRAYLDLRGVSERMCALLGESERRLAQAECERAELRIDCDFLRKEATYHVRRAAVCIRCIHSFFAVQDEEVEIYKTAERNAKEELAAETIEFHETVARLEATVRTQTAELATLRRAADAGLKGECARLSKERVCLCFAVRFLFCDRPLPVEPHRAGQGRREARRVSVGRSAV